MNVVAIAVLIFVGCCLMPNVIVVVFATAFVAYGA